MSTSSDAVLADLLDRWEDALERGEELTPEQLCPDSPEIRAQLARQIAARRAMDTHLELARTRVMPADPQSHETVTHRTISSFSRLQRLAQGGLGIVYRATDDELHREVVLKFIHRHIAGNSEFQTTFRREAEVTSRLDHPGVVPVYGIGDDGSGCLFYVMRYIQGETLDQAIQKLHDGETHQATHGLEVRNLLQRFVTICKTIAYAHNRGILHRDIKPDNIMLGRYGETLVVDWGLAIPVGRDDRFKESGELTLMPSDGPDDRASHGGTPAFMSPEATANADVLTPATDIYSLGASLYKLLTGRVPFEAAGLHQLRDKVLRGDFPAPGKAKHGTSKSLEAICLKAMHLDPAERYATALELAADVERYLADEPVTAYQESWRGRAARWSRRHGAMAQAILGGVAAVALVTVVLAAWLGFLAQREYDARVAAEAAQEQSLRMAAKFAARTIAGQIDNRWRILEAAGKDAAVTRAVANFNASPKDATLRKPAQDWLNDQYIQLQTEYPLGFSSLFVLSQRGIQVARAPLGDSIGNSFAYRDYFHGQGRDLPEKEPANLEPIKQVNLSATYASSTSGKLKVAFTVPLIAEVENEKEVIGVLGMSVDLGEFGILETELQSGQFVVLIDLRVDALDGQSRRGLILQHPSLSQRAVGKQAARIAPTAFEQINAAKGNLLLPEYQDPILSGRWMASFAPVVLEGRRLPIADTGWGVLVQERSRDE